MAFKVYVPYMRRPLQIAKNKYVVEVYATADKCAATFMYGNLVSAEHKSYVHTLVLLDYTKHPRDNKLNNRACTYISLRPQFCFPVPTAASLLLLLLCGNFFNVHHPLLAAKLPPREAKNLATPAAATPRGRFAPMEVLPAVKRSTTCREECQVCAQRAHEAPNTCSGHL